ncbi:hypothetical protein A3E39_02840 [Candidatus Uhrbacteria bacterium RIFCSPHIGHO2_12_FULL_60_25]|uniref:Uncharacterized protein n=1 Tax=Candidatus Uhrbacteria bacterium RIFCSPHIGHO2_12_FULL_60_25 TaxID=1802399 RepID=A0A1F7UJE7_9BACT|nr:MAG: hypothetical protein A3E39_02840 [Candidatus Uhrbacteria bacterium RIFCSPHIGHO2_12_FULL_60_25]
MKKLLTTLAITATILAPVATRAATVTVSDGDLIKGTDLDTVYYYYSGYRYVFPTEKTYKSWYGNDFSTVKTIAMTQLTSYSLGRQNVTYRPGTQLLKITTDPKTYAVGKGGKLRWVQNEAVAKLLWGNDWAKQVHDLPDPFFINYQIGDPIASPSDFSPQSEKDSAPAIWSDKGWPQPAGSQSTGY